MPLVDKTQLPQPAAGSLPLPARFPTMPEDAMRRFPSLRLYQEDVEKYFRKTRAAIYDMFDTIGANTSRALTAGGISNVTQVAIDGLSARISSEETARIDGDAALAATIASIVAAAGTSSTVFVQASAPTANNINDLWLDSDDGFKPYYWDGVNWVDGTDTRITANISAITNEATVRASADGTLATSIASVLSIANANTASISTITSTYATSAAVAASIATAIATEVTDRDAAITSASSALTTAFTSADSTLNTALGGRITDLESSVDTPTTGLLARVTTIESTYATTTAVGAAISTAIDSEITDRDAAITTSASALTAAYTAADSALNTSLSASISALSSTVSSNLTTVNASIASEASTRASADTAISSTVSTLSSTVSTNNTTLTAAVTAEATARATADGHLSAKYTLQVISGNIVTGMNLTSSSDGGTDVSDITFQASSFKVYNGTSGVAPFQIVGGAVRVSNLSIISSDVSGLAATATSSDFSAVTGATKPANNADVTLTAVSGGLNITSGGITLSGTALIKSSNYVANTTGWAIKPDGSVDFASGDFRGAITSTSGSIGGLSLASNALTAGSGQSAISLSSASSPHLRIGSTSGYHIELRGTSVLTPELTVWNGGTALARLGSHSGTGSGSLYICNSSGSASISMIGSAGLINCGGILTDGTIAKATPDGWTPALVGTNNISFKWTGAALKVKIDVTEFTIAIS